MVKLFFAALICLVLGAAAAMDGAADAGRAAAAKLAAALNPRQGMVDLPGAIATLDLPPTLRYLTPEDGARLLAAWGDPPDAHTLGMIVPAGADPATFAYGVVITYDKNGHVQDDDADDIDYAALLRAMQAAHAARRQGGIPAVALPGWAEAPHYDKASHKLVWAEHAYDTPAAAGRGLHFKVRILGREGVLALDAGADMRQLGQVSDAMRQVTAFTNFTDGNRYADFDRATDRLAGYGIAVLVAGDVAARPTLLARLLAYKKLLVAGLAVLGVVLWQVARRLSRSASARPFDLGPR